MNSDIREENVVDIFDLIDILKKRKQLIVLITLVLTTLAVIYVLTMKPVYQGKVAMEIGKVYIMGNKKVPNIERYLDEPYTLAEVIKKKFSINASVIPKTHIVIYTIQGYDKEKVEKKLKEAIEYTLQRHKKNMILYSGNSTNTKMSYLINGIEISDQSGRSKTLIILAGFLSALVIASMAVFLLEFLKSLQLRETK